MERRQRPARRRRRGTWLRHASAGAGLLAVILLLMAIRAFRHSGEAASEVVAAGMLEQGDTLSDVFEVCAWSEFPQGTREIMGIRHKEFPLLGMQFHPESFLTGCGPGLLARFLAIRFP